MVWRRGDVRYLLSKYGRVLVHTSYCSGRAQASLSLWHSSPTAYPPHEMSRYPSHLSPNITPTKSGKAQKSRARREPSGVFSLFQPQQIQQFKEAFSLIDQDRDGLVGERDLKDTFSSLGAHDKSERWNIRRLLSCPPPNRLSFTPFILYSMFLCFQASYHLQK